MIPPDTTIGVENVIPLVIRIRRCSAPRSALAGRPTDLRCKYGTRSYAVDDARLSCHRLPARLVVVRVAVHQASPDGLSVLARLDL